MFSLGDDVNKYVFSFKNVLQTKDTFSKGLLKMTLPPGKSTLFFNNNDRTQHVTEIPGIGRINGEILRNAGCITAHDVLKKLQELGNSEVSFMVWLQDIGITNSEHKRDCYRAIKKMA